jgi:hypothetical protein
MTPLNKSIAVLVLLAVVGGSALVAYRSGFRRGLSEARPQAPAGRDCIDFHQAAAHSGEQSCVAGRVLRAFTSRSGNTFLDFCDDYRNCPFTSVIFASDRGKFGDLTALQGRQVELRGKIQIYHDQPEIVLDDPAQIQEAP